MIKDKYLTFDTKFQNDSFESLNSEFKRGKCYVAITGKNLNDSIIQKESFEKAIPSIYNIPIVAEFFKNKKDGEDDYGTHGGKVVMDSNGIEFIRTTNAYGTVPESCNCRWEEVNGVEMFTVDVIVWSSRFDEMQKLVDEKSRPQSMEIRVSKYHINNKDEVVIDEFEFSALCILGSDVKPAMPNSEILLFENESVVETEFEEMVRKYKEFEKENKKKGGANSLKKKIKEEKFEAKTDSDVLKTEDVVEEVLEDKEEKYVEEKVEDEVVEDEKVEDEKVEDEKFEDEVVEEDEDEKVEDEDEKVEDEDEKVEDEDVKMSDSNKFSITYKDLRDSIEKSIVDVWTDYENHSYIWVMDFSDDKIYANKYGANNGVYFDIYVRYNYSIGEDSSIIVDYASEVEVFTKWLTKEEISIIESETEGFKLKIKELSEFKDNIEKEIKKEEMQLSIDEFEKILKKEEEFVKLKDRAFDMEVADFEKECYVLIGKISFKKEDKKTDKVKAFIKAGQTLEEEDKVEDKKSKPYGDLDKFLIMKK